MLTLSSLVLVMTLLCAAPPARAGSFVFAEDTSTYPYTVTPTMTPTSLQPPKGGSNRYFFGACSNSVTKGGGDTATTTVSVTINLKGTWTHGTGQTDANDPPPPTVWLYETGSASWSGMTRTNTPPTGSCVNPLKGGEVEVTSTNPVGGTRSGHQFTKVTVSGGVVTLTRTFSGTASAASDGGTQATAAAGLGSYQVTVHAQPYNFRSSGYTAIDGTHQNKSVQDNANATLSLSYVWDSTDGDRTHLGSCTINEKVTWDSNPQGIGSFGTNPDGTKVYAPPSPPVGTNAQGYPLGYPDPTVKGGPATAPGGTDTFSPDAAYMPRYYNVSWWGDQTYVFSDTATGEKDIPLPGPASGSFRITRTVALIPGTNTYGLTKYMDEIRFTLPRGQNSPF